MSSPFRHTLRWTVAKCAVLATAAACAFVPETASALSVTESDVRPGPNVPEPMVFDLIRPLGVRQGEFEANVLGILPLSRLRTSDPQFDFVGGSDSEDIKSGALELAPEIEYGLFDNFAVELELPIVDSELVAVKGAAQYTFTAGTTANFTHGVQNIVLHDLTSYSLSTSLLYLAGYRFSPRWSALAMLGANREFGGDNPSSRTLGIFNASLFAQLGPSLTLGLETNYANTARGNSSILVMPQVHARLSERFSAQIGVGSQTREGQSAAEMIFRLVAEL